MLFWLNTVWKHQLTVITMPADSFRYSLWAGRLQPLTYMFMIANNGRVEMSNHQGEFQYNQYTRRSSLLSPLPSSLPLPSGPSPSSFRDDLWPYHSRIPHRTLYRRKVEVTTSSTERVHFIKYEIQSYKFYKKWNFIKHVQPFTNKANMPCNGTPSHTPTHPHTLLPLIPN